MSAPASPPETDDQPKCPTCKGARWVKDDSEWPHPLEAPCPDCTDGICEGCEEPGNTCRECDEEWCSECWDTEAHGEHCPGKGHRARNCDNVDCPAQGTGPCDCGALSPRSGS